MSALPGEPPAEGSCPEGTPDGAVYLKNCQKGASEVQHTQDPAARAQSGDHSRLHTEPL